MDAATAPEQAGTLRGIPAARIELIERIVAAARRAGRRSDNPNLRREFLRAYFRGVAEEDLRAREPEALASAALAHLELGMRRAPGRALIRVFNPDPQRDGFTSPHTIVLVVTDDMPFLVDSLGIVFDRADVAVHLIVHPVLAVRRERNGRLTDARAAGTIQGRAESWQMYEIDRQIDPERIAALERGIESALADVRAAVEDWMPMRERVREIVARLESDPPPLDQSEVSEARRLLDWIEAAHFVFLGYRYYRLERGRAVDRLVPVEKTGLGILRTPRRDRRRPAPLELRGELRRHARKRELLVLTKANSLATVHRSTYLDYVGVKDFDARGEVCGEHRFLGLWTSAAYHSSPREIPVLRRKVESVIDYFGLDPQSHDGKAVLNVLETYPRDELFQASAEELIHIVRGVVNLYERRTVRLLVRRDPFRRFYSCLVYVPRDRYNTEVRHRIEEIVRESFGGRTLETQVQISESNHARLHIIVRTDPEDRRRVDLQAVEQRIAEAATTWIDRLLAALASAHDEAQALALANRYRNAFPMSYQEDVEPRDALEDLADLEALKSDPQALRLNLHRPAYQRPERVHLKIVKRGDPVPISDILPVMENFGLRVIAERPYELAWPEGGSAWIQDFELEHRAGVKIDVASVEDAFKEMLQGIWRGEIENDGLNRLLLGAGLVARQIVVLRAYCRYLMQTGMPFSQAYIDRALAANPAVARDLVQLFELLFDPGRRRDPRRVERTVEAIRSALDAVASVDEDRILRAYLHMILATLRTNHWQTDASGNPKPYLSFKFDPQRLPELPAPRPKFEIFVYSPRVEGVHLRMGYVARGGIRWSDRREDFRTEILGLMKAQNVKNTLIVPVGAKGGFVVKRPPAGSREELQREVVECYRIFIRGLLDLTDNIVGGRIVPPARTVRHDGDDAYLVVAADKGTATFSDIANALSEEYGFWLGDAFASGGSAGYDHKKMGITARGAWECVKRHFRELGIDIQSQDFTVAGIGDMSGDVFGNGMLLSKHIRLLAAFNHQHIFLDPDPDAATSYAERERLFRLPRSTWDDYDRTKLSRGGGIYPRSAKSITLSPEAQKMLGLPSATATPQEVIRAILRMPVDLLWNGGIGTYVKASDETHAEIGDRANDSVRVNGCELRARVVGEGGNLGFSQRGRIEYALSGGRINTDFIDNSGGVNASDVEVNLKILLNPLEQSGRLRRAERNRLLARMTDEVAGLVLRNNYLQSQALSILELQSAARLGEYQQFIRTLERAGELDRALEFLPSDEEFAERRKRGIGLTRPELAIVLAYGKIWLNRLLIASDVPEDPYLSHELERYFPGPVRERFSRALRSHRLRREIIATATTNSLVNRMGPTFVMRAQEQTGADVAQVARAYTAAREIFEMRQLWARIEALDNRVPARLQYSMMYETSRLLRHMSYWLLAYRRRELQVDRAVAEFRRGVRTLESAIGRLLVGAERERYESVRRAHIEAGVPAELAGRIASLEAHNASLDIVDLAAQRGVSVEEAARVYFEVGARVGLDWLRDQIERLSVDGPWQAVARTGLRDSAFRIHRRLAERVLTRTERGSAEERVNAWTMSVEKLLDHWQRTLADMRAAGSADFATLSVGVDALRKLAD
ncbi:MAG: NAD-glutamate dehydrogenase [Pseudomonadota bacterium]